MLTPLFGESASFLCCHSHSHIHCECHGMHCLCLFPLALALALPCFRVFFLRRLDVGSDLMENSYQLTRNLKMEKYREEVKPLVEKRIIEAMTGPEVRVAAPRLLHSPPPCTDAAAVPRHARTQFPLSAVSCAAATWMSAKSPLRCRCAKTAPTLK